MKYAWLWVSCLAAMGCGDGTLHAFEKQQTTEAPAELLIDDFEDGDARATGALGWWYLVNDRSGTQRFGIEPALDRLEAGYCIRTQGMGFSDWGAALGLNLLGDQPAFDGSDYQRLTFWARAAVESSREVSVELLNLDHRHFAQTVTLDSEWREMSMPLVAFLDDGVALDPSGMEALQLFFPEDQVFDIWLDDLRLQR